jgi:hypothetical protein
MGRWKPLIVSGTAGQARAPGGDGGTARQATPRP